MKIRVSRTTPAPALQEAFNDTSHPGVSLSPYLPQGRRQIRAGASSLRDSFHPQAAPALSRSPPRRGFIHAFINSFVFSTLSCGFGSITCTIQCIIKNLFFSRFVTVSQSPNCSQNLILVKCGYIQPS